MQSHNSGTQVPPGTRARGPGRPAQGIPFTTAFLLGSTVVEKVVNLQKFRAQRTMDTISRIGELSQDK